MIHPTVPPFKFDYVMRKHSILCRLCSPDKIGILTVIKFIKQNEVCTVSKGSKEKRWIRPDIWSHPQMEILLSEYQRIFRLQSPGLLAGAVLLQLECV